MKNDTDTGPMSPPAAAKIDYAEDHFIPRNMKILLQTVAGTISFLSVGCFSALAFSVSGNTYVTTGAQSDVQAAVNAAPNGATVTIPDGSYTWSSQLNISNYVILRAANMPTWPTASKVNITHGGGSTYLIAITASSAGNTTLAGINFLPGSGTNTQSYLGTNGSARPILMHDCTFNIPNFQLLHAVEWRSGNGVVWYCHFFGSTASAQGSGSGSFYNEGNLGWLQVDTFGALDTNGTLNMYVENCIFDNLYNQATDFSDNARAVVRYCTYNNSQGLTHGVTGVAGGRAVELYNNSFNYFPINSSFQQVTASGQKPDGGGSWVSMSRWFWWRAGTARVHDNTVQQIFSYGYYGTAASWQFIDESLTRTGQVQTAPQTDSDYPGWHWPGTGGNGTSEIVDPVYVWNNSYVGNGALPASAQWSTNDQTGFAANPVKGVNSTADVFLLNRDIFLSAPPAGAGGVAGTYATYTYPHPLRSLAGAAPASTPMAPKNLTVQ